MNLSFIRPRVSFPSLDIYQLATGGMASNCYLLVDKETAGMIIIDPGDDPEYIGETILRFHASPQAIVATHGHFDHILGGFTLQHAFRVPFYLNSKDMFLLGRMQESARYFLGVRDVDPPPNVTNDLLEGTEIRFGKNVLRSFPSPGHTPGSVSLTIKNRHVIFVGDVLFAGGGTGRTDFSYSDRKTLILSIRRIMKFPDETIVFSGHGEPTTVGKEKMYHRAT